MNIIRCEWDWGNEGYVFKNESLARKWALKHFDPDVFGLDLHQMEEEGLISFPVAFYLETV